MNLKEIIRAALYESGGDPADEEAVMPHLRDYINEAYDRLLTADTGEHLCDRVMPLTADRAVPELPEHCHRALADYAASRLLRTGGPQKQSRAGYYETAFRRAEDELRGGDGRFCHLPK